MSGYTKLAQSLLTSTIWSEDDRTRIVWITMLALANAYGEVEASVPGLAKVAGVPVNDCEKALEKLAAPDPYSRTKDHDGRRIKPIDGGWFILNYERYRRKWSAEDRREQDRLRQQRHRARQALSRSVTDRHARSQKSRQAEAEAEEEEERGATAPSPSSLPAEVQQWNSHPGLPAVQSPSKLRIAKLRARRKDPYFVANWQAAIDRICQSGFCIGQNDRGWKADFDWFLKPDTVARVMEGKYDNHAPAQPESPRNCI
jgi:hypothetical protein